MQTGNRKLANKNGNMCAMLVTRKLGMTNIAYMQRICIHVYFTLHFLERTAKRTNYRFYKWD